MRNVGMGGSEIAWGVDQCDMQEKSGATRRVEKKEEEEESADKIQPQIANSSSVLGCKGWKTNKTRGVTSASSPTVKNKNEVEVGSRKRKVSYNNSGLECVTSF